jgi:hypothetical protein
MDTGFIGIAGSCFSRRSTTNVRSTQRIEDAVWQVVARALQELALIAQEAPRRVEDAAMQQDPITGERASLTLRLAQCEKELKKWEEAY